MELSEFWTLCSSNGIVLNLEQLKSFERYATELAYWNEKVNLISRQDTDNIYDRHILHSLALLKYMNIPKKAKCLDGGTGGGLPGIPLSIARPDLRIKLVDSIAKKMTITSMLAAHTSNKYLTSLTARLEQMAREENYYKHFDYIVTRAVAKIEEFTTWVKPMLREGGRIIFYKGGDLTAEMDEARKAFPKIQFEIKNIKMFGADWMEKDDKKLVICGF
jgi:16S rRNA (guanine527-N7)-methyltransferase